MRRFAFLLVALGLLANASGLTRAALVAQSQSAGITFKSEVNYVEVNAVITDARGNFVRDLKKEDFEIYEDGKLRPPAVFRLVELPVSTPKSTPAVNAVSSRPVESDVRSALQPFDGRLYVLVLDDLHVDPLRGQLVRAAARRFVEQYLSAGDLAAVIHTAGTSDAGQQLTSSRQLILAAIDRFQGRALASAAANRLSEYMDQLSVGATPASTQPDQSGTVRARDISPVQDPDDAERANNARRSLATLRESARWLADIQGRRKALLFLSEGIDYDFQDLFNNREASGILADVQDAIGAATRSNVSIYSINPRGLASIGNDMVEVANLPWGETGRENELGSLAFENGLRLAQDSLRTLSEETGGLAFVDSNDFARGFERIVRDNSSYYLLGYYADPDKNRGGGTFRKIDVRVRRPGLQVRARHGYVTSGTSATSNAPDTNGASSLLRDAIARAIPGGNLPLTVSAAQFRGTAGKASVVLTVEIEAGQLKFQEGDGRFLDALEMSIVAVSYDGSVKGTDHQKFNIQLGPDTYQRILQSRVRLLSQISLPPARYQLRVAAAEGDGKSLSVAHYDLDVPDYDKQPLALSGILLTSSGAGAALTARPNADVLETIAVLPHPPTTARAFSTDDTLWAYTEIYDRLAPFEYRLEITTTVRADDGRIVSQSRDEQVSPASQAVRTHHSNVEIPLKSLPPGAYVLTVDVRSNLSDQPSVARQTAFQVTSGPASKRPVTFP
jgi:VWFA-related protein